MIHKTSAHPCSLIRHIFQRKRKTWASLAPRCLLFDPYAKGSLKAFDSASPHHVRSLKVTRGQRCFQGNGERGILQTSFARKCRSPSPVSRKKSQFLYDKGIQSQPATCSVIKVNSYVCLVFVLDVNAVMQDGEKV